MTSQRPRIVQAGRLLSTLERRLAERYDTTRLVEQADQRAWLAANGAGVTGLVTSAGTGIAADVIAALPDLRVISSFGVGLDKLPLAAAAERGIAVGYTPDVLNDCVADLAIALLLDIARRVSEADRFVRRGGWSAPGGKAFPLARKVSGAKLGIVGLGRIGRTIARRADGFEMAIRYHSRRPVADAPWQHEPSLHALARWCDHLVVITAGGAETRHLIDAEVLDALGPRGFLVNVSRGSVVDEQALVRALAERRIAGAGLDVFEDEPRVPAELLTMDNVVLLPHIASATEETREAMAARVLDNLEQFYADGTLLSAAPLPETASG
ncbi:2-hydroxyacid dehydrogenase [Piscinibacter sakaiensis]|uniref:2-hydroxyacid dehydrogenase n=1 Tax=Piscinibacter sakaiensis TaxID=1547922 RepID=UPI003AAA2769